MYSTKRIYLFSYLLFLIGLGLASRKFGIFLPDFIATYSGDTIWAFMVFIGFCWLFPSKEMLLKNMIFAFAFSFFIEFSQLYQADWMCELRKNTFAKLILGQGFLVSDFICYTVGILIGFFIQHKLWKYKKTENNSVKSSK